MVKQNRDFLKLCGRVLINIIQTTGLTDQEKLCEISKIMYKNAEANSDYTTEMKESYEFVYKFLSKIWADDFLKIVEIVNEN